MTTGPSPLAAEAIAAAAAVTGPAPAAAAPAAPGVGSGSPAPAPPPASPAIVAQRITGGVIALQADQLIYFASKRAARRAGLQLSASERAQLHLSEDEKDELEVFSPSAIPYLQQYADWIGKIGLALFAFALWSMYQDRRELIARAVELKKKAEAERAPAALPAPPGSTVQNPRSAGPAIVAAPPGSVITTGPVDPFARARVH